MYLENISPIRRHYLKPRWSSDVYAISIDIYRIGVSGIAIGTRGAFGGHF